MNRTVIYALPYPRFFSQHGGIGGHVAHCLGIIRSLNRRGIAVTFLAHERHEHLCQLPIRLILVNGGLKSRPVRAIWLLRFLVVLRRTTGLAQPSLVYMRYSASAALFYPLLKKALKRVPLVLEVNSLGSQRHRILTFFDRRMLSLATTVVCISESLHEFVDETLGLGSIVVPNGIDPERIPSSLAERTRDRQSRETHVVYAGLLKPEYGLEESIEALDPIADERRIRLTLYGDGPLRPVLRSLAASRSWLSVAGAVDFDRMPELLADADILLYPTSEFNKFQSPTKLFEYMAAARPIVAARTQQTTTLLDHGRLGLLFEINDVHSLRSCIQSVLDNYDEALSKATDARREVLAHHTWDQRLELILKATL